MRKILPRTLILLSLIVMPSLYALDTSNEIKSALNTAQQGQLSSLKPIVVDFWDQEFAGFHMHQAVRDLIKQIDEQKMQAYLNEKGIKPTQTGVTLGNLIGYFQDNHLGNDATYAWMDLQMGKPDFLRAVLDWNAIQKTNGYEFIPTYYLLFNAKLESKKDCEVWSDLFKATYSTLKTKDRKALMLWCLMPRVLKDLKLIEKSMQERFEFLASELETIKDLSQPYAQALAFNLYWINFETKQFAQAAKYGKLIMPQQASLTFVFSANVLAKDLPAVKAMRPDFEKISLPDEQLLNLFQETIKQMEDMQRHPETPLDTHQIVQPKEVNSVPK